jgi:molybdopterin converting factor small subunit
MTAKILAFGIAKDIFGASVIELELPDGATAGVLRGALLQRYPPLGQLAGFLLAVNNEYAETDLLLDARDEVAVIPPVSGG